MGRPSSYTDEIADKICERLANGESLLKICNDADLPDTSTVYRWLEANKDFRDKYARAREQQADFYAAEIIEIADDGSNDTYKDDEGNERVDYDHIARSRLRVDARKWYASKLAPKKYGDKLQAEVSGKDGGPVVFTVSKIGEKA